jgi:hypothetical protein
MQDSAWIKSFHVVYWRRVYKHGASQQLHFYMSVMFCSRINYFSFLLFIILFFYRYSSSYTETFILNISQDKKVPYNNNNNNNNNNNKNNKFPLLSILFVFVLPVSCLFFLTRAYFVIDF